MTYWAYQIWGWAGALLIGAAFIFFYSYGDENSSLRRVFRYTLWAILVLYILALREFNPQNNDPIFGALGI